jgi:hypothetical protein
MPARRSASDKRLLERALEALARALDDTSAPWMIIGGIAVIARGVRRFTTDIDVAVRGDAIAVADLVAALAVHDIQPRIPQAARFARENLVLLARHAPTGVDLDVSLAWSAFEHRALAAATSVRFGRARARMSTAEDLVVFKAIAGRPRDLDDAEALLVLHPQMNRVRVRERVVELAQLAEAPELVGDFDAMLSRVPRAKGVAAARRVRRSPRDRNR